MLKGINDAIEKGMLQATVKQKSSNQEDLDSSLHVDCVDCEASVDVVGMPWLALCTLLDVMNVPDMVAFLSTSKAIRLQFWNDDSFWERQFIMRFGSFIPSCFKGVWRDAFALTYSRGVSYVSKEVTRRAISTVCNCFSVLFNFLILNYNLT